MPHTIALGPFALQLAEFVSDEPGHSLIVNQRDENDHVVLGQDSIEIGIRRWGLVIGGGIVECFGEEAVELAEEGGFAWKHALRLITDHGQPMPFERCKRNIQPYG